MAPSHATWIKHLLIQMGPTQNMLRHIPFAHQRSTGGKKWDPEGKLYFPVMQPLKMVLHKQTLSDAMQSAYFMKAEPEDQQIKQWKPALFCQDCMWKRTYFSAPFIHLVLMFSIPSSYGTQLTKCFTGCYTK